MTTTTHATVFDIQLLQKQICAQLTLRDIRPCCLVSKDLPQLLTLPLQLYPYLPQVELQQVPPT